MDDGNPVQSLILSPLISHMFSASSTFQTGLFLESGEVKLETGKECETVVDSCDACDVSDVIKEHETRNRFETDDSRCVSDVESCDSMFHVSEFGFS